MMLVGKIVYVCRTSYCARLLAVALTMGIVRDKAAAQHAYWITIKLKVVHALRP
jgi:hypothetical protein